MSQSIHQAHDKFFKRAMSKPEVAREFLQQHLPASIQQRMDFSTLQFHKETFIDEAFKTSSADVVYSAQTEQGLTFFYVLVEHQSTVDPWLALRLWNYLGRLWQHYHTQQPDDPLPLIYPLIFYNGEVSYTATTRFLDLFNAQAKLMQEILIAPFRLIDISQIDDAELRKYRWAGILEFVMKHRFVADMITFSEEVMRWLGEIEQQPHGFAYANDVIQYIYQTLEREEVGIFTHAAQEYLSTTLKEKTMTMADYLRQEGYQKGVQRTMEDNQKEKLEIAKKMLQVGLDPKIIEDITGVRLATEEL